MRSRRVAAVVCIAVGGAALALPALPRAQQNAPGPPPVQAQTDLPLFAAASSCSSTSPCSIATGGRCRTSPPRTSRFGRTAKVDPFAISP